MKHYLKDPAGCTHVIEEYGWCCSSELPTVTLCIDNRKVVTLRMYYKPYKTWDEFMGNKPCGYYCNASIPGFKGKKRIWLKLTR